MRVCCSIGFILLIVAAGCSGENSSARVAQLNRTNILKVSNLYSAYQQLNGYSGPKDAAALKQFVASSDNISPKRLEKMQIDPKNLDPIFVSERDGKPFKVRPKVQGSPMAPSAVVFEETGIDGKREVGFTNSTVQEVDDAKYNELWNGKDSSAGSQPSGSEAAKSGA